MKKQQLKAENYKLCNIDQVKVDEILDKYPSNRKASAVIPVSYTHLTLPTSPHV